MNTDLTSEQVARNRAAFSDQLELYEALMDCAGKAEVVRLALATVDNPAHDLTVTASHGLQTILREIEDTAWDQVRDRFPDGAPSPLSTE